MVRRRYALFTCLAGNRLLIYVVFIPTIIDELWLCPIRPLS